MIELGPFELDERIGGGAMGDVWRARHRQQGTPVAVKVITTRRARDPKSRSAFRNEMRSMATLGHPNIILLLDVGEVTPEADIASNSEVVAQSPFLAMELAHGTLVDRVDDFDSFAAVRRLMTQLLDALAHAHARDVIHRDIKPMNVLVGSEDGMVFKLADFGVAHVLRDPEADVRQGTSSSGTPRYMAPEQVVGDIREQGPWTDIYALGCVVYWLASGDAPYSGKVLDVLRAHLEAELPRLTPRFAVPAGFEALLRRMLARYPIDRYRRAADVMHDLMALDDVEDTVGATRSVVVPALSTDDTTIVFDQQTWNATQPPSDDRPSAAPMADSWRGADATLPEPLIGAGLGLYHMRQVPLVDRDAERDVLWQALRDAHGDGRPRAVIVRGAAGVGKTRLVQWLAQRAHELGAATPLKATHAPIAGPLDGVGTMLARHVRGAGLERIDVMERLRRIMSHEGRRPFRLAELELLADVVAGGIAESGARPADRRRAVGRLVEALAQERPVMLWLDDVQWGVEALELALQLVEQVRAATLIVATVRDEALGEQPLAGTLCERLLDQPNARELTLGPLAGDDHLALVRRLLALRSDVADSVAERTQGNALFAVQLVGDWIERGVLEVTADGLALGRHEGDVLPYSIHALWTTRLSRLWQRSELDDPRPLEIAAALGQEIDTEEWSAACDVADVALPEALLEHMLGLRLAIPHTRADGARAGWSFAHGMLRESIEQTAEAAGRRRDHHRACAAMLRERGETRRVAEHLLCADDYEAALGSLLDAAEQAARRGNFEQALALDDRRDSALDAASIGDDDKRRVLGRLRRARTECLRGELAAAREDMRWVEAIVDDDGDVEIIAELRWVQTIVARHDTDFERGVELGLEALSHFQARGDVMGVARCHKKLGELYRLLGQSQRSTEHYLAAQNTFEEKGDHFELAWTSMGLGSTSRQQGDLDQAHAHARKGLASFERIGSHLGVGHAHNELGEVDRQRGNYAQAEQHYEKAIEAWQRERHRDFALIRFNIALAAFAGGDVDRAHTIISDVLAIARDKGRRGLEAYARAGLSAICGARGQWETADEHLAALRPLLSELNLIDIDLAQALTSAGEAAARAGREATRNAAFELAIRQWDALGDAGRVVSLRSKLHSS